MGGDPLREQQRHTTTAPSMYRISTIAAIVGTMLLSPAAVAASEKVVTIEGSIQPQAEMPDRFNVTILFDIKEGWHTYDVVDQGAEVPTTLKMSLPEGAQVLGDWSRPLGMEGLAPGSFVHEGRVEFSRGIVVTEAARGKEIAVTINYQACTEEYCNPPQKKTVSVLIPASAPSTASLFEPPVRVMANGEILSATGGERFLSPALHDLDGDGRAELVLGSLMGKVGLHRNLNTSGKGDAVWGPREDFLGASGKPIRTSNW